MSNAATFRRLRARDLIGSASGFFAVLLTLVIMDPRIGHQFSRALHPNPAEKLLSMGQRLVELGNVVLMVMHDQGVEHAPLLILTAIAVLLVGFMLRT
jgi:excinuclease UvrABC ATPase subunit